MVQSTISQKMTTEERNYLLWFDAMEFDQIVAKMRDNAYMSQDFGKATRLETISAMAHKRLFRRYENLVH